MSLQFSLWRGIGIFILFANFYVEPVFGHLAKAKFEEHSASGYGEPNKIYHLTVYGVSVRPGRPWPLVSA